MSGKRRHRERLVQLEARKLQLKREAEARGVAVDTSQLAPDGSYNRPDFVERGYYVDQPFTCQSCGVEQVWTAAQQKWWYEVAKGGVWTTARLCRPCRKTERSRREETRRVQEQGLARKKGTGTT
jgi:hypothetical protein